MRNNSPFALEAIRGGRRRGAEELPDNQRTGDRLRRLESRYASEIPIDAIAGLSADNIQTALEELAGGVGGAIQSPTTDYAIAAGDAVLFVDATAGPVTITLPAAATSSGRVLSIKKIDGTSNAVIIDGNAAETIDGGATASIVGQYVSLRLCCDGTEWWII